MRILVKYFLVLLVLASGSPTRATDRTGIEFPFEFREGLIWVKVQVRESSQPLNFILDTGANVSVINLPTARKLGLQLGRPVRVEGVSAATAGFWPEHLSSTAAVLRLPEDFLGVNLDELSRGSERTVDGLLGADFFRRQVVRIDFANRKIQLNPGPAIVGQQQMVPLRINQGALRVPISVNGGREQWVRLDTGCDAAAHWVAGDIRREKAVPQMAVALTKMSIPFTQANVRIGQFTFGNLPIGLHENQMFAGEAGLLGNGVLSRFSAITVDTHSGFLLLER